jgi:hypothetical protein
MTRKRIASSPDRGSRGSVRFEQYRIAFAWDYWPLVRKDGPNTHVGQNTKAIAMAKGNGAI